MKKVLVIHHTLQPAYGDSSVGAWVLQALAGRYQVTVLTWEPVDLDPVNRAYGTGLRDGDFTWVCVPPAVRRAAARIPFRAKLLTMHLMFRHARAFARRQPFDVAISTMNETDIGVPTIQYVHYPWIMYPRPAIDYRAYHFSVLLRLYRAFAMAVSGFSRARVANNLTLVNSDWTGAAFRQCYGGDPVTVYPPVPGGFPEVAFAQRARGFTVIGRIAREKELEKIIIIVRGVRARGHDVALHIVGHMDDAAYGRRVYAFAEPHREWVHFHHDLPRDELVRLVAANRYGIHGMVGEHFGIAPAELQRGGCITFVPDDGGPVEIVGGDERVIYHSVDDAIDKISKVVSDPELEAALAKAVDERRANFTETRFMDEIVKVVEDFTPHPGR